MYVDRRIRTVCSYCGVGCQLDLLVSGGKVVGTLPADGPSNRGRLGPDGTAGLAAALGSGAMTNSITSWGRIPWSRIRTSATSGRP